MVKGFKVFNNDWTCLNKQYTCPGKFEEDVEISVCNRGMHFCKNAVDCFNYYSFDPHNHIAEVVAYGDIVERDDKCCTDKLEIVREIPWQELLELVNTGKGCRGFKNSGNRNSGDWNKTNFSSGCFNTEEQTIMMFNKPSDWTYRDWYNSKASYLLNNIQHNVLKWIYSVDMTDEEKEQHPEYETTGGYLKELDESECAVNWWQGLSDDDKSVITAIPNFDAKIFKEITGVDVECQH